MHVADFCWVEFQEREDANQGQHQEETLQPRDVGFKKTKLQMDIKCEGPIWP